MVVKDSNVIPEVLMANVVKRHLALALIPWLLLCSACSAPVERLIRQVATVAPTLVQPVQRLPTTFTPAADVAQLSIAAGMTDKARTIFFAAQPVIDTDRLAFSQHCGARLSNETVELGCYTADQRIYILNLGDDRLKGEMVVVAAHEMLHAAYDQLSRDDQTPLNAQLEALMTHIRSQDLAQRLKTYRILEPGQRDNELHSILGTEFAPLSIQLEQYYNQYFANRQAIVADATAFDQLFTQLRTSMDTLQSRLLQMRRQLQTYSGRRSVAAYNRLVPQYNALVQQYNQAVHDFNALSRDLLGEETPASVQ
jgi:hypothetical protein